MVPVLYGSGPPGYDFGLGKGSLAYIYENRPQNLAYRIILNVDGHASLYVNGHDFVDSNLVVIYIRCFYKMNLTYLHAVSFPS